MIDVHSHIIPGIDDGSRSIEDTIEILKEAETVGFTDIITTSHYIVNNCETSKRDTTKLVETLQNIANVERIDIKLHIGAEIYIDREIISLLQNESISTLANSKNVLIELPMNSELKFADELLFKVHSIGLIPVIAHPERYEYVQNKIEIIDRWREQGTLMQCNFGSLIGLYGHKAEKTLKTILKKDLVDFFGSDCHRPGMIYDKMPEVLKNLTKIISTEKIKEITEINPRRQFGI